MEIDYPSAPATSVACDVQPATVPVRSFAPFALFALLLCVCFCVPLYRLVGMSLQSSLYSHVLLVPFITFYLIWIRRSEILTGRASGAGVPPANLPLFTGAGVPPAAAHAPRRGDEADPSTPSQAEAGRAAISSQPRPGKLQTVWVALLFLAGIALLLCYWSARWRGWQPAVADYLSLTIFSFVCLLVAGALFFLGSGFMRAIAFPVTMLIFMVPFPVFVKNGIEFFFQHTSADAASALFTVSGSPFFREGLLFHLPGIDIVVAEECSGIRSSLVLFITGLLAANLFLRSPWKRAALVLFVIPLGIVRNGFRIFTIGMLCVHIGPHMIHSPIHRRGGPIFFLLSLIPFFIILLLLRKSERQIHSPPSAGVTRVPNSK